MPPRSSAPAPRPRRTRTASAAPATHIPSSANAPRHFAIIGAGMAGIACARTLVKAGHQVTVFEKADQVGGRTATCDTPHGSFDAGTWFVSSVTACSPLAGS